MFATIHNQNLVFQNPLGLLMESIEEAAELENRQIRVLKGCS